MIYRVNAIPIKFGFFAKIDKLILKFSWKCEEPRITKTFLKEEDKVGKLTLLNLKSYYKDTVIQTVWSWHKDRRIGKWHRIESPELNLHIHGQFIFLKKSVKMIL